MNLSSRPFRFLCAGLVACAVALVAGEALAQTNPTTVKGFGGVQNHIAKEVVTLPKLVAYAAYIMGTFFAVNGLMKLKDWMGDSDRNTLNAALTRLVVASLLVYLPYGIMVANTTIFGQESSGHSRDSNNVKIVAPEMQIWGKRSP